MAWKRERQAALLDRAVDRHVLVGVDRLVARRGDHEPDDAVVVAELLDELQARLGLVHRQVDHRLQVGRAGQDLLAQPAAVGPRHLSLDERVRVHPERQQGRREDHLVVDPDRLHLLERELDLRRGGPASRTSPGARCGSAGCRPDRLWCCGLRKPGYSSPPRSPIRTSLRRTSSSMYLTISR